MDDNAVRVEFPDKDFKVIMSQPTGAQMFLLMLSRTDSKEDITRAARRIARVLEELMGPETWDAVFEKGFVTGALQPDDLGQLARDVLQFDWPSSDASEEIPEKPTTPEPVPGPRVVSGG